MGSVGAGVIRTVHVGLEPSARSLRGHDPVSGQVLPDARGAPGDRGPALRSRRFIPGNPRFLIPLRLKDR